MNKLIAGALIALAFVKVHTVADDGIKRTRVVVQQPFAMPIDNANAYCLRRLDDPIIQCALGFQDARASSFTLMDLPFCQTCYDIAMMASSIGRDDHAVAVRRANMQSIVNM